MKLYAFFMGWPQQLGAGSLTCVCFVLPHFSHLYVVWFAGIAVLLKLNLDSEQTA
jgi:hypothetical protein